MAVKVEKHKNMSPPKGMDFHIAKVCHVVLQASDLERSTAFYAQDLGLGVFTVYPDEMMPGGTAFLCCHRNHRCVALVGTGDGRSAHRELNHLAFEVPPLAEIPRAGDRGRVCSASGWRGVKSSGEAIASPVPGQDTYISA